MTPDFLLWQWSLIAQLAAGLIIAGFFVAFRRAFPTPEIRAWTLAWLANLASLLVTIVDVYWIDATTGTAFALTRGVYILAKGWFLAFLLEGLWLAIHPGRRLWPAPVRNGAIVVAAVAGGLTLQSLPLLGLLVQGATGIVLGLGAGLSAAHLGQPVGWLTLGLALRASLGIAEALAHAIGMTPPLLVLPWAADTPARLLAVSSSFDMMAEWLLALGCVLAATGRSHRELASMNDELRETQQALRALVETDPLTGLASRRALPAIMREVQPHGAAVVFLDLHGFKAINDRGGHHAGDDALRRFATALRESFRPQDAVLRYAGDEFMVVARGLSRAGAIARVEALRARMSAGAPAAGIDFDAGHAELEPGGVPEVAIRTADRSMYEAKASARRAASDGR